MPTHSHGHASMCWWCFWLVDAVSWSETTFITNSLKAQLKPWGSDCLLPMVLTLFNITKSSFICSKCLGSIIETRVGKRLFLVFFFLNYLFIVRILTDVLVQVISPIKKKACDSVIMIFSISRFQDYKVPAIYYLVGFFFNSLPLVVGAFDNPVNSTSMCPLKYVEPYL